MISHGVEISIAGGVGEILGAYLLFSFFLFCLFLFLSPFLYLFKVQRSRQR